VPTYQYACTACGEQLEAVQSFTEAALTECPECAGTLRKVFSAVGVVFKGSGFYKNDSRAGDKKAEPAKESTKGESTKGESKTESAKPADSKPSEAKPAAKAESKPAGKPASSTPAA